MCDKQLNFQMSMSAEREQILVNNSAQTLLDHLCVTVVLAIGLIWMVILAMVTTFLSAMLTY